MLVKQSDEQLTSANTSHIFVEVKYQKSENTTEDIWSDSWKCIGGKLFGKCKSNINKVGKHEKVKRYHCQECDNVDICFECLNAPFVKRRLGITEYDCKKPRSTLAGSSKNASLASLSSKQETTDPNKAEIQTSTLTSIETPKEDTTTTPTDQSGIVEESYEEKISKKAEKYQLNKNNINKLQLLNTFKVVFILDDSTSMNKVLNDSPLNDEKSLLKVNRWDELIYFTNVAVEIASLFNSDGSDVYFLNRFEKPIKNVTDFSQLSEYFKAKPNGTTPLTRVLKKVLNDNSGLKSKETNLLVVIVTDGEPTNDEGNTDIIGFQTCLNTRSDYVYTNIIACTDEDDTMTYLKDWDKLYKRLAIIDDYRTERNEIRSLYGIDYSFSFGDYVMKSLIGSIDHTQITNVDASILTTITKTKSIEELEELRKVEYEIQQRRQIELEELEQRRIELEIEQKRQLELEEQERRIKELEFQQKREAELEEIERRKLELETKKKHLVEIQKQQSQQAELEIEIEQKRLVELEIQEKHQLEFKEIERRQLELEEQRSLQIEFEEQRTRQVELEIKQRRQVELEFQQKRQIELEEQIRYQREYEEQLRRQRETEDREVQELISTADLFLSTQSTTTVVETITSHSVFEMSQIKIEEKKETSAALIEEYEDSDREEEIYIEEEEEEAEEKHEIKYHKFVKMEPVYTSWKCNGAEIYGKCRLDLDFHGQHIGVFYYRCEHCHDFNICYGCYDQSQIIEKKECQCEICISARILKLDRASNNETSSSDINLFEFHADSELRAYLKQKCSMDLSVLYIHNGSVQKGWHEYDSGCDKVNECCINHIGHFNKALSPEEEQETTITRASSTNLIQQNEIDQFKSIEEINSKLSEALIEKSDLIIETQRIKENIAELNKEIALNEEYFKTIEENKTKLTSALEERERLEDELKDQKTELKRVETKLKTEMTTLSSKLESTRTDTVVKTIVTKKEQTDYRKLNEKLSTDITYLTQVEEMNEQLIEALNERERLVKKIKKFQNIEIQDFKRDIEIEKEEIKKLQERYFKEKQVLCSLDEINKKLLFSQIDFGESNKTIDINNNIQCGIKKVETIESFTFDKERLKHEILNLKSEIMQLQDKIQKDLEQLKQEEQSTTVITEKITEKEVLINEIENRKKRILDLQTKNSISMETFKHIEEKNERMLSLLAEKDKIISEIKTHKDEILKLKNQINLENQQIEKEQTVDLGISRLQDEIEGFKSDINDLINISKYLASNEESFEITEDTRIVRFKGYLKQKLISSFKTETARLYKQVLVLTDHLKMAEILNRNVNSILNSRKYEFSELYSYKKQIERINSEFKLNLVNATSSSSTSRSSIIRVKDQSVIEFKKIISNLNIQLFELIENLKPEYELKKQYDYEVKEKEKLLNETQLFEIKINSINTGQESFLDETCDEIVQAFKTKEPLVIKIKCLKAELARLNTKRSVVSVELKQVQSLKTELNSVLTGNLEYINRIENLKNEISNLNVEILTKQHQLKETFKFIEKLELTLVEKEKFINEYTCRKSENLKLGTYGGHGYYDKTTNLNSGNKINKTTKLKLNEILHQQSVNEERRKLVEDLENILDENKSFRKDINSFMLEFGRLEKKFEHDMDRFREVDDVKAKLTEVLAYNENLMDEIHTYKSRIARITSEYEVEMKYIQTYKNTNQKTVYITETRTSQDSLSFIPSNSDLTTAEQIKSRLDFVQDENAKLRSKISRLKYRTSNTGKNDILVEYQEKKTRVKELRNQLEDNKECIRNLVEQNTKLSHNLLLKETNGLEYTHSTKLSAATKIEIVETHKQIEQEETINEIRNFKNEILKLNTQYLLNKERLSMAKQTNKQLSSVAVEKENLYKELYTEELNRLEIQTSTAEKHLKIHKETSEKLEVALAEKEQLLIEARELKNELVNLTSQHEYNLAHLKSVQEANQNLTTTHRYTEQLLSKIKAYRDNISSLVSRLEANEEISNSATVTTVASNNKCGSSEDSIESIEAELININKMFEHELRKFSTIENQSEKLFLELKQKVEQLDEIQYFKEELIRLSELACRSLQQTHQESHQIGLTTKTTFMSQISVQYENKIRQLTAKIAELRLRFEGLATLKHNLDLVKHEKIELTTRLESIKNEYSRRKTNQRTVNVSNRISQINFEKEKLFQEIEYLRNQIDVCLETSENDDIDIVENTDTTNISISTALIQRGAYMNEISRFEKEFEGIQAKKSQILLELKEAEDIKFKTSLRLKEKDRILNKFKCQKCEITSEYFDKFSTYNNWASFIKIDSSNFNGIESILGLLNVSSIDSHTFIFFVNSDVMYHFTTTNQAFFEKRFQQIQNKLLRIPEEGFHMTNTSKYMNVIQGFKTNDDSITAARYEISSSSKTKYVKQQLNKKQDSKKSSTLSTSKSQAEDKVIKPKTDLEIERESRLGIFKTSTSRTSQFSVSTSTSTSSHKLVSESYSRLAKLYIESQDFKNAEIYFKKALDINQEYENDKECITKSLTDLGICYLKLNKLDQSKEILSKVCSLNEELYKSQPNIILANSYSNLGLCYQESNDFIQSVNYFKKALAISIKLNDLADQCNSYIHLGLCYFKFNLYQESKTELLKACDIAEDFYLIGSTRNSTIVSNIYTRLGLCYQELNDFENCERFLKRALLMNRSIYEENQDAYKSEEYTLLLSESLTSLGLAYFKFKILAKCEDNLLQALKLNEQLNELNKIKYQTHVAASYSQLGLCYQEMSESSKAIEYLERALALNEMIYLNDQIKVHRSVATSLSQLGVCYFNFKFNEKSIDALRRANEMNEKLFQ